jgi:SAM-dependent methyltransferase
MSNRDARRYWDGLTAVYQRETRISCEDFHYGPLLAGDRVLGLLPEKLSGLRCLELGAGAAQNSIYLASQGAHCLASDISGRQLAVARQLAAEHQLPLELFQADLDELPMPPIPTFDLIHSTYALPFARNPQNCLSEMGRLLLPGGTLLLTTAHPLSTGEWLEVDENEHGLFVPDYFHPPVDERIDPQNGAVSCSRPVPLGTVFHWLREAGLEVDRLLEPCPLPIPKMSPKQIREQVPYDSVSWRELYPHLAKIPFVVIFRARKPAR